MRRVMIHKITRDSWAWRGSLEPTGAGTKAVRVQVRPTSRTQLAPGSAKNLWAFWAQGTKKKKISQRSQRYPGSGLKPSSQGVNVYHQTTPVRCLPTSTWFSGLTSALLHLEQTCVTHDACLCYKSKSSGLNHNGGSGEEQKATTRFV